MRLPRSRSYDEVMVKELSSTGSKPGVDCQCKLADLALLRKYKVV
jgi:hypothetical protein